MHTIFGGPFHDQATNNAFQSIENTPHLIVGIDEQRRQYAHTFINILQRSGYSSWRLNSLNMDRIDVWDMLYSHDCLRNLPKSDWTNEPPQKRIPYFSLFHIGESRG